MRGDYFLPEKLRPPGVGPSPHAWGLPIAVDIGREMGRAIPTCVGTTDPAH
ncbi:conserved hypothetical protein [Thermus scotoductus SA-01]|uniref:Uncharacterized protein n=1 Tax=Thermus scotoductus (strain ATCC 700910 / SA-01) TaxID=743525 RepID=E8PQU4_THESS|nr:conserved hypothetical protein [Thermus scotoductus SA-01]